MAGPEDPSFSAAEREKIATLRAVADLPTDAAAVALLASSDWDLQAAADAFLSGGAPPPAAAPPRARTPSPSQPPPPPPRREPRWLAVLFAPLRAAWATVSRIAGVLLRLFGGQARAIELAPGDSDTRRFLAYFDDRFRAPDGAPPAVRPAFHDGGYLAALAAAQRELKFLVVYLHSDGHPATAEFVRRVVQSPAFVAAVDAAFVAWAGSVTHADAAAVQHALRVDAFPFIAIVAPPRGTVRFGGAALPPLSSSNYGLMLSSISGAVLHGRRAEAPADGRGRGDPVATAVVGWMDAVQRDHAQRLDAVRRERESRDSARVLRREQDEEYAATLEADRAREREKARAEEEAAAAAAEAERAQAEARAKDDEVEQRQLRKRESLPAEPEKAAGVATVVLRLPEGDRAERRFAPGEVLETVFNWAEGCCGVDVDVACLVSSYPRKVFRYPEDGGMTLDDAGFFPSAMLLLEERTDDVDGSS